MMDTAPNNQIETPNLPVDHLAGFARHFRILKGLRESSVAAYSADIRAFFAWSAGNGEAGDLGAIGRQDVERYLEWCYYQGNQGAARARKFVALRNFFRYLVYAGALLADPTAEVPRLQYQREFMQTLNQDEVLRMFAVCDIATPKGLRDAVILIMGAFTGFRVSEIYKFNVEQVSDDGKDIDLVIPKTKRGAGRIVYLWKAPGMLIRRLLTMRIQAGARTGDPLLVSCMKNGLPRGNRRLTAAAVNRALQAMAKRAGLRKAGVHNHMLRATHACDLQRIHGYTPQAIMERLGIRNLATLEHYLVRRERIHHTYRSLHEYWGEFPKIWTAKEDTDADTRKDDPDGGAAGA
jgi:site-specific recombinase XerD